MLGYGASLFVGMFLAVFTVPLYRWLLGDYWSILVVIGLGFVFSGVIQCYTFFGRNGTPGRQPHFKKKSIKTSSNKIEVDKYGRIFDPEE